MCISAVYMYRSKPYIECLKATLEEIENIPARFYELSIACIWRGPLQVVRIPDYGGVRISGILLSTVKWRVVRD